MTESADFYLVENTSDMYAFLKLTSEDPNLIALLYHVNSDGTLGNSTGFGVFANQSESVVDLPIGKYAIVIGSVDGSVRGSYSLHWNRSNPVAESAESSLLLNINEDLSKVTIYYSDNKILSNGNNLMTNLAYEERRDFYVSHGYAHITTSIYNVYETADMYLGSFSYSGNTSYSTESALIIEITRAGYSYLDRYYQNFEGDVTSWIRWEDPVLGLRTPRVLGDDIFEQYFDHYLVLDLNTDEVIDFVSSFNYFYAKEGRTFTLDNLQLVNY